MTYVDGFVAAVPTAKKEIYRAYANETAVARGAERWHGQGDGRSRDASGRQPDAVRRTADYLWWF